MQMLYWLLAGILGVLLTGCAVYLDTRLLIVVANFTPDRYYRQLEGVVVCLPALAGVIGYLLLPAFIGPCYATSTALIYACIGYIFLDG